ncbi:MAG: alpha/beta hydrolase [Fulvivirga sp.]
MSKPKLIVLHGALGSAKQLKPLCNKLEATFDMYTLDFSGHGGRAFDTQFTIHQFASELRHFISENNLQGVDIFGFSMGGYVALKLAETEGKLLGKIHTLGTKFAWSPETAAKEVQMLNPDKIEEKVPAFAKALADRHAPNDWKEVLNKTKEMMLGLGEQPALNAQGFNTITNSVIIGIGSDDHMVSIEESQHVANQLTNGKLKVFEGFKHPIEQVDHSELSEGLINYFK